MKRLLGLRERVVAGRVARPAAQRLETELGELLELLALPSLRKGGGREV